MKNTKKMQALDENGSRSVPHDTTFIRASFRKLIRTIVLVSAVLMSAHGAVFLGLGDPVWKVCAALVVAAAQLYYMTGPQRGFSAFLAGTLALLALLFFYVTYMVAHMGSESGFQYLILVAIPIVIVAGRIGLLSKWLIVVGMVLYLLALDSGMVVTTPAIPFALDVTMGFHAFNIALVALVLGVGAQRHFIVMSERQSLLFQQASIDPLTGLFNRRGLFEVAEGNVARARRFGSPLAVILGDVDLFKQVNDQHGHTIGDAVLRQVGAALKEVARDYDSVCRWGGEEFLIVLPETTLADAAAIAERIRVRFASKPLRVGTTHQVVTMTMGVAQLDSFELLEGTIYRADQSLYVGKRQGRNQVVLAT
jgi:diguanylate cyclase (GGDEF)-like protein